MDDIEYLGAAHGIVGVLHVLIQTYKVIVELKAPENLLKAIEASLEKLLLLLENNGGMLPDILTDTKP